MVVVVVVLAVGAGAFVHSLRVVVALEPSGRTTWRSEVLAVPLASLL
jgi:hypothetical protein